MPLQKPFIVLMTGDIDINHSLLKHRRQNIIVTSQYDAILMHIETTRSDLILLDLPVDGPDPRQSELIARIKDPLGINGKTPVIAIINPTQNSRIDQQFDDSLTGPLTEQRLNEIIDLWQTRASAQDYIQIILSKTKNNRRLTLTLFEKLFEELPLQAVVIKDALENKQYDLAREVTHKLNGSVSFCGLTDIQQPANALESDLLNTNYASTHQHFLILQQCILNFTRHQKFILTNLDTC